MKEKEIIKNLKTLGELPVLDENTKIKTRWHLERLAKTRPQPERSWRMLFARRVFIPAICAFLLLLVGSWTTAVLAEDSLPGDTLYPVKKVNENIKLLLALRPDLKAKVRQNLIDKRFNELDNLSTATEKKTDLKMQYLLNEIEAGLDKALNEVNRIERPNPKQKIIVNRYLTIIERKKLQFVNVKTRPGASYYEAQIREIEQKLNQLEDKLHQLQDN